MASASRSRQHVSMMVNTSSAAAEMYPKPHLHRTAPSIEPVKRTCSLHTAALWLPS